MTEKIYGSATTAKLDVYFHFARRIASSDLIERFS